MPDNLRDAPLGAHLALSVVIPAHNEAGSIGRTVNDLVEALEAAEVEYEVIVVDDASSDDTEGVVRTLAEANRRVRYHRSHNPRGFGFAVRAGLDVFEGDAVAVVMADGSDDPDDPVRYHHALEEGYDCAFGSRFVRGSSVSDYPRVKLALNRVVNTGIRVLFRSGYNDTTNAFKAYRREVVDTVQPLLSNHFNLTVELPLKAIVRGYTWTVVPTNWYGRESGESKFIIKEMGSRYLFIILYCLIEKYFSRGDYLRPSGDQAPTRSVAQQA